MSQLLHRRMLVGDKRFDICESGFWSRVRNLFRRGEFMEQHDYEQLASWIRITDSVSDVECSRTGLLRYFGWRLGLLSRPRALSVSRHAFYNDYVKLKFKLRWSDGVEETAYVSIQMHQYLAFLNYYNEVDVLVMREERAQAWRRTYSAPVPRARATEPKLCWKRFGF